jgi:hypothetical protein
MRVCYAVLAWCLTHGLTRQLTAPEFPDRGVFGRPSRTDKAAINYEVNARAKRRSLTR